MKSHSRLRRHPNTLGLWMNGRRVGSWTRGSQQLDTLHYDTAWLQHPQGRPVSLSLPLQESPICSPAVRAYFDNLLPDRPDIRNRMAARFQARSTQAFDLLAEAGRDCAGALQILPPGDSPEPGNQIQADLLSEAKVASLLRSIHPGQAGGGLQGFRISIAGAQEKTALLYRDGQWLRPRGSTATTHILKLPLGLAGNSRLDLSHSLENEWLCSQILREYGLATAHCDILSFEDQRVLSVQRFDRRVDPAGNLLLRLPQEDMCQATATPSALKYECDGGPGMDAIMAVLAGSRKADADRQAFFMSQLVFWLLNAPDGHAKNFSIFLLRRGAYQLAPFYDVLSASPWLGSGGQQIAAPKLRMAMAVRSRNTHYRHRDVQRRHWQAVGERYQVARHNMQENLLARVITATGAVASRVAARVPAGFPASVLDPILTQLEANSARLQDAL